MSRYKLKISLLLLNLIILASIPAYVFLFNGDKNSVIVTLLMSNVGWVIVTLFTALVEKRIEQS